MNLLEILKAYFKEENISLIGNEVFRCVKRSNGSQPYQVVYVDGSNGWVENDLQTYLEPILANDYYSSPGYLQWNFYYYFISVAELISENTDLKKEIETDESFARKFVMTIDEFNSWLDSNIQISAPSTNTITKDLFSIWLNSLKDKGLYFVYDYSDLNFKKTVEDYIEGTIFQENEITNEGVTINISGLELTQISSLKLEKYRKYPKQDDFNFGSVVLINGPNATGKTSLLDAIELVLTGDCSKLESKADYKLEMTDVAGQVYTYPDRQNKYKNRDSEWYKNFMTRGHNLNNNFNRFNYFTSDAAFELKLNDGDENKGIEKIIADIALGKDVNKLEERIIGFKKRFEDWDNQLSGQIQKLSADLQQKDQELTSYRKEIKDPNDYRGNILNSLNENGWLISIPVEPDEFVLKLDDVFQLINNSLDQVKENLYYINSNSFDFVTKQVEGSKQLQNKIQTEKEVLYKLKQDQLSQQKNFELLNTIKPSVDEIGVYYNHESFESLKGLAIDIKSKIATSEHYQRIINIYNELPITDSFINRFSDKSIHNIEEEIINIRFRIQQDQKEVIAKISELEEGVNNLEKIITDIKSLGKEYVTNNPESDNCPLCDSKFDHGKLIEAIEKTRTSFSNAQALLDLKEKRQENVNTIVLIEIDFNALNELKQLCLLLNKNNSFEIKLSEVFVEATNVRRDLPGLNNDILRLNSIQAQFTIENLTEERFDYLNNLIRKNYDVQLLTLADFLIFDEEFKAKFKVSEQSLKTISEQIVNKSDSLNALFTTTISSEKVLSEQIFSLQQVISVFDQIKLYITIDGNSNLISISENINKVRSSFEIYKKAYQDAKQYNRAIEILSTDMERCSKEIDILKPKKERAETASTILNAILTENNKNIFLSDYINHNRREIVDIFKLIHTPKEFDDIRFDTGKILLFSGNESRSLTEISTGQRSALALSIFMSLNKKLDKGPNIILFDDPVAYIDDLNILSFFDYLRELVLTTKRQIFFVTANQDLAFLFKKKFEFLGENNFSIIKFDRVDELAN